MPVEIFFVDIYLRERKRERERAKDSMDLSRPLRRTATTLDALSKHAHLFFSREFLIRSCPPFLLFDVIFGLIKMHDLSNVLCRKKKKRGKKERKKEKIEYIY